MRERHLLANRDGFSFVEALVAIVLLAVLVTALAAHLYSISRGNLRIASDSHRNAVITRVLGRLAVQPYDDIEEKDWIEVDSPQYPHSRKIEVVAATDASGGEAKEIRLIIKQTIPITRTDTAVLIRSREYAGNPFNMK